MFDFPVSDIREAPENGLLYDRFNPSADDDAELIENIWEYGVLVPLRMTRDRVLIDGHRRLCAARHLGLATVPVIEDDLVFEDLDENERLSTLAAPNVQRQKTRDERLREVMVGVDKEDAYADLIQHRAERQRVKIESNVDMGARKRRPRITTMQFLNAAIRVIDGEQDFWPVTERRVHYLLLNDPPLRHDKKPYSKYENTRACSGALSGLLTRARLNGSVPMAAIEDPTRHVSAWSTHAEPQAYLRQQAEGFAKSYWRDLMQGQEHHVEILVEKEALRRVVEAVAEKYTIPCTCTRGFSSLPPRYAMSKRYKDSGKNKLILLILSDFDPDGEQIAAEFSRSLRDDFGVESIHPIKVLLGEQDVRRLNLPSDLPAKRRSSNYKRFVEKYGSDAVTELDAVPTALIQQRLREAVESVIDVDTYNHEVDQEKDDWQWLSAAREVVIEACAEGVEA